VQKNFVYNDSTNIEAEFEAFVKELNLTGEEILVISIGIKNNEYINLENLENIAENNGALKTYILIKNILSIGNSEEGTSDLSIEELEKNLISNWNISNIEKFSASFSELKELFSNGDKDSFLELFDKTLEVNEDDN
jgi:exonuclease sbcD